MAVIALMAATATMAAKATLTGRLLKRQTASTAYSFWTALEATSHAVHGMKFWTLRLSARRCPGKLTLR